MISKAMGFSLPHSEERVEMTKEDLGEKTPEELGEFVHQMGEPAFRSKQLFEWIQVKKEKDFQDMQNLPKNFREKLEETAWIPQVEIKKKLVSQMDGTVKYLYRLPDGETVEAVLMRYRHGNSLCISTQVGCRMGCTFCASTKLGLARNLSASEMLAEIDAAEADTGEEVKNVVLMGIGEPLDNYDEVLRFLKILSQPNGRKKSLRNVTLSTCGLVPEIKRLAEEHLQLTLAVSLHAPDDEIRRETMPIANRYSMKELLTACQDYGKITGRRVTFEYALIQGQNDSLKDADLLAKNLHGILCHVNLIPINPIEEKSYKAATKKQAETFRSRLEQRGIPATVRRTLGEDINAACGQLRRDENTNA